MEKGRALLDREDGADDLAVVAAPEEGEADAVSDWHRSHEVAGVGPAGGTVLRGDEHDPHLFRHPAPATLQRLEAALGEDGSQPRQRPAPLRDEGGLQALAQYPHGRDGITKPP